MKYNFNNTDRDLLKYDGQQVAYLSRVDEKTHRVRFEDGHEAIVNADEIINPGGPKN